MAVLVAFAGPLAAQDTSKAPPAPAPVAAAPAATAITAEAVLTRGVIDRMPQDTLTSAPADVGQLTLWTRVSGAAGQTIHHVWFFGETQVADIPLNPTGSPFRTWSRKTITPDMAGPWHVEVRDANGSVITRVDFTVGSTP